MNRVCVIGSANMDFVVTVPTLPSPGETVIGGDLAVTPGGKGANQAVAARRLGAEVRFVALLGQDPIGDRLAAVLAAEGLDAADQGRIAEAPTGVALILVDAEGRNQIAVAPGANRRLTVHEVAARLGVLAWADVVLLQLEIPLETVDWVLGEARRLGKRTVLNPAPAPREPLPQSLLRGVDVITPNETEAGALAGLVVTDVNDAAAAGRRLVAAGVEHAVVTVGPRGAVHVTRQGCIPVEGFAVSCTDTVGAGDAFSGALAACLARGIPVGLAVTVANAAGALTCERRGAMDALPTHDAVRALLHRTGRMPAQVTW